MQAKDSRTINVAGRQRMLSQKIAKLIYSTQAFPEAQQSDIKQNLDETLALFQQSHEGLLLGSQALSLTHQNSRQVSKLFDDIAPAYAALNEAGQLAIALPYSSTSSNVQSDVQSNAQNITDAISQVSEYEADFLTKMNEIVSQYELEATERVLQLKLFQRILLALILLTLLPMLLPIYQVTQQLNSMLMAIESSSDQVSESSLQIAASGEQIESMVTEQAATSAQITASSKEIATIADQLKQEIARVVEKASAAQEKAVQGEQEIAVMAESMARIEAVTAQMDQQLEIIDDRSKDIDQVVLAMTKVSDQINLLSLNAAIEAEKAGEAGAGFSVVAQEIRRLADKSAVSTLEIEALIKEMQAAVATGVEQIEHFAQQVRAGIGSTDTVAQQLGEVIMTVKALMMPLTQVNQGMSAQADGAEQIRDAMTQLSIGSDQTVQSLQDNNGALIQLQIAAQSLKGAA